MSDIFVFRGDFREFGGEAFAGVSVVTDVVALVGEVLELVSELGSLAGCDSVSACGGFWTVLEDEAGGASDPDAAGASELIAVKWTNIS